MKTIGAPAILVGVVVVLLTFAIIGAGWDRPPIGTQQMNYRGLGMVSVWNPRRQDDVEAANQPPAPLEWELSDDPTLASDVYENVPVLGHLTIDEFNRLMAAITEWVSPEQGCNYCHGDQGDFASDEPYAKRVSARMIQMTQNINANWSDHVAPSGVNCYTCHRGQPVPQNIWFGPPTPNTASGMLGNKFDQNMPSTRVALSSLPYDPFATYLAGQPEENIRVIGTTALPIDDAIGTKAAEKTYGLMMHMSQGLGVNCTYCHNTRSFFAWDQSTPQRTVAYHGIQMVQELNGEYLRPLAPEYPPERLGPQGEPPKANCTTCHNGVAKPMYGAEMVADYPNLTQETPQ